MVFSSVNVFIALYDQCFCTDEFVPWAADGYRDPYMNQAVVHLTVWWPLPYFYSDVSLSTNFVLL